MTKNLLLLSGALILVLSCFCFSAPIVRAEDPLLKIQVTPDQNTVKSGMMFLVHVQVLNTSSDSSTDFWSNTCSYEKHWVSDNAGVVIQSWSCNENTLEHITLEPGDAYAKNIILYIPKKDKTAPVTFRLGFKRMSEDGDIAGPLWSDPITMNVIVPEEMREVTPPAAAEATSQASDQASATPAETSTTPVAVVPNQVREAPVQVSEASSAVALEPAPATPVEMSEVPPAVIPDEAPVAPAGASKTPAAVVPNPSTPAGSQPVVFQDPDVPIRVLPGEGFSIVLASNPSTGFRWSMTLLENQKAVKFLGSEHVISQKVMPGVPGEDVYKFKALTPGETKADFVYARPWEPKTAPTRKIFTILVSKK